MGGLSPFSLSFVVFLASFMIAGARPPSDRRKQHESPVAVMTETMGYLKKYGYFNTDMDYETLIHSTAEPRLASAIRKMQGFFRLPATGVLDRRTLEMMKQPRCGCPDFMNDGMNAVMIGVRPPVEYNIAGRRYRWSKTDLTFTYLNFPSGKHALQHDEVRRIIRKAFRLWSEVTPLNFREVEDSLPGVDIKIKFGRRRHHPDEPSLTSFDGTGGDLAHAFLPNSFWGDLEGDIHFDDDEMFTDDGAEGFALLLVAAHEIGHSLGLAHSDEPGSLMWPNYQYMPVRGYRLPADDVQGIQAIYGPRLESPHNRETDGAMDASGRDRVGEGGGEKRLPDAVNAMCQEHFTALLKIDEELFAFRNNRVWRISLNGRQLVSPPDGEMAKSYWRGMPSRITAAYQRQDGNVVFFKGDKYYTYRGKKRVGRPMRISTMGVRRPPMAALRAGRQAPNKAYLLRGDQVWLYDEATGMVDEGYPRAASEVWRGLPSEVTGGEMLDDGSALFLKGNRYFEVDTNKRVTSSLENRASLFSFDFLGCAQP